MAILILILYWFNHYKAPKFCLQSISMMGSVLIFIDTKKENKLEGKGTNKIGYFQILKGGGASNPIFLFLF